jgi:hypothetical protein
MIEEPNYEELFQMLVNRYRGADPAAILRVLTPITIPMESLDKTIIKVKGQSHYRATFSIRINDDNRELLVRGRTGKFVPQSYVEGGEATWREIAKGRIIDVNFETGIAFGEVYTGGTRASLVEALESLSAEDYLEIDQYGAAAKVLSGLVEYTLARIARESGYSVRRMPEDIARHLGAYYHYDFEFEREGVTKKIEVKSLWGTNTKYARLIHSKTKDYLTSSCKFETQDIFAVSLFLRTGDIRDFAFARSISSSDKSYGLPHATNYPDYVHQNPICEIGNGSWFATIDEVWQLD